MYSEKNMTNLKVVEILGFEDSDLKELYPEVVAELL